MSKKDIVIGLNSLDLRAQVAKVGAPALVDTAARAHKKRVFTAAEWDYLNSRPTAELHHRIKTGDLLIGLLYRPEMLNMTPAKADKISSNLRFQQDAIRTIIEARKQEKES